MTVADLETLYSYACWANAALLAKAAQLPPARFTEDVAGSYGSVRNTLVHVLSAEWGWLSRCGGPPRGRALDPLDYPTVESLAATCSTVEGHFHRFLATLADEDLLRSAEYVNAKGEKRAMPIGELLQHAIVHGVHHRGQAALLLRVLDVAPGNFDLLLYHAERRGVAAW